MYIQDGNINDARQIWSIYPEKQSLDRIPARQDTPGRINMQA